MNFDSREILAKTVLNEKEDLLAQRAMVQIGEKRGPFIREAIIYFSRAVLSSGANFTLDLPRIEGAVVAFPGDRRRTTRVPQQYDVAYQRAA